MAIGGFSGSDPAPTLAEFEQLVARHEVHYFVNGGGPGGSSQITSWVAAHFTAKTVGGSTVYDLTSPTASTGSTGASAGTGAQAPVARLG